MILVISMTRRNMCAEPEMNGEVGILTLLNATYVTSRNAKTILWLDPRVLAQRE